MGANKRGTWHDNDPSQRPMGFDGLDPHVKGHVSGKARALWEECVPRVDDIEIP